MYKYKPNGNKLTFKCAGEVTSRWPGGIVEMCHHANIVENHSAEVLFSIDHLFKGLFLIRCIDSQLVCAVFNYLHVKLF